MPDTVSQVDRNPRLNHSLGVCTKASILFAMLTDHRRGDDFDRTDHGAVSVFGVVRSVSTWCAQEPSSLGRFFSLEEYGEVSARARNRGDVTIATSKDIDHSISANSKFSGRLLLNLGNERTEPRKTRQPARGCRESGRQPVRIRRRVLTHEVVAPCPRFMTATMKEKFVAHVTIPPQWQDHYQVGTTTPPTSSPLVLERTVRSLPCVVLRAGEML
jgi:hypothetical protein